MEDATYFNHELLQSMGISIAKHRLEILKLVKKEEGAVRPKKLSLVIKKCLRKCMSKLVFHGHNVNLKNMPQLQLQPQPQPQPQPPLPLEPNWHQGKWKGMVRKQGSEEVKEEKPPLPVPPMYRSKTIALSGPLDGRVHEKMDTNKAMKLSGPLDGRMHERMMVHANRSPIRSGRPMDGRFTKGPRLSGPLDARMMAENRSPRMPILRHSDATRAEAESPLGYSPNNKLDFDFDDDHTLWPSLFQDLKPT